MPIPEDLKQKFGDKYGAFVTLNRFNVSGNPLRGCIGYIEPKYPLYEVIHNVSVSSATEDPRLELVEGRFQRRRADSRRDDRAILREVRPVWFPPRGVLPVLRSGRGNADRFRGVRRGPAGDRTLRGRGPGERPGGRRRAGR